MMKANAMATGKHNSSPESNSFRSYQEINPKKSQRKNMKDSMMYRKAQQEISDGACFGSTYTKLGTIQRRLAWPLGKDDMQICEAFHIFIGNKSKNKQMGSN